VVESGHELSLNPAVVRVDVAAFGGALEADRLEAAVRLYAGPFLDGFHVSGMPELERWMDCERRRHADRYGAALQALALRAEEEGHPERATGWWRKAVAHEPYSSRLTLRLMEALSRSGDHVAALEAARTHECLLREELEVEPAPEVAALAEELRETPPSVPGRGPGHGDRHATPFDATPNADPPPTPVVHRAPRTRTGRVALLGGAVGIVLLALFELLLPKARSPDLESDLVVVDPFSNQTGDPALDPVGAMAGHWLVQSLHAAGLRVVPFDVSLAVGRSDATLEREPDRLWSLARAAGARIVVSGSYYREGDKLRLQAEIADAERGEVLFAPDPIDAPLDRPSLAFAPLRVNVRDFLYRYLNPGVVLDTIPGWTRPPDFEAYRRFLVGMEYFIDTEWGAASDHFEAAARLDPDYPAFRYMSAIALGNQGRAREAADYLARIDELQDRMTPYDRATVAYLRAGGPAEKLRAARRMTEVGPSYVGFFLVALHTLELNRPAEALGVLERPTVGPLLESGWPPYWNVRVEALHALGRYQEELRVAREGLSQHPDAPSLVGIELPALAALGRTADFGSRTEELLELRPTAIGPLIAAGDELHAHGHPEAAARVWKGLVRQLGPRTERTGPAAASPDPSLVELLERLERDREARQLLPGLAPDSLAYFEHLGILAARRGDGAQAESALAWLAGRPGQHLRGRHLLAQARIAAELGDTDRAIERLGRALRQSGAYTAVHRDYHLRCLRGRPDFESLATPAPDPVKPGDQRP
jgi:tetratricopeptide (TPR) repeat protein